MSKKRSHLLSSPVYSQNTVYDKNVPNITLNNDNIIDFGFKVKTFFSGPILYHENTTNNSVALYGGNVWGRNDGGHGWDLSMWPGQFQRKGNTNPGWLSGCASKQQGIGAGKYLVDCNPSCGTITQQKECIYSPASSTSAITTDPNLNEGHNTCCVPYYDINQNITKQGNELIFNSYFGLCYPGGPSDNWSFCTNKQIWISGKPNYLDTVKLGDSGYADTLDSTYGTMLAASTNTKDITFFGGAVQKEVCAPMGACYWETVEADPWCSSGGGICQVQDNDPQYFNPPQKDGATVFPAVPWSNPNTWSASGFGVAASPPPNNCPVDCPIPNGFVRWGEKPNVSKPSSPDNTSEWDIIMPGDQQSHVSWMPSITDRELNYYPLINAKDSADINKLNPILGLNYDFSSLLGQSGYANATDLAMWMSSVARSTSLEMSTREYVAYGSLIHGAACAIYNDFYSDNPASGLTIFNPESDFIRLYFAHDSISGWLGQEKSFKIQLAGNNSGTIAPVFTNGLNVWTNVIGNNVLPGSRKFIPDVTLISKLIRAAEITPVEKDVYNITFSESICQFFASDQYKTIVTYFQGEDNPQNYELLIATLNQYINERIKAYFGSQSGGETMQINGSAPESNTQSMTIEIAGSEQKIKNINVSFNCWDMVNAVQLDPILAYDYLNSNGSLGGQTTLWKSTSSYHAISINYTAKIVQFSPMAVLYYSYKAAQNAGKQGNPPNLDLTDPMCQYNIGSPSKTIAPSISCMHSYVHAKDNPRERLFDVCLGGFGSDSGYGGFNYKPPLKVSRLTTHPWDNDITADKVQITIAGDGSITNYLFSQNQGQTVPAVSYTHLTLPTKRIV